MDYEKMWDELTELAGKNTEYLQCLNKVEQMEKYYLEICKCLSPEQQRLLEEYICACEELKDCMIMLAFFHRR